jgi:flagellar motor switch protein FliN/FliY
MSAGSTQTGSALDLLLDIELPVTLRFGRRQMTLQDVIGLNPGSVIDFGQGAEEPVEVLVNGRVVARGEAVMVQGNYGVRISQIENRRERLEAAPVGDIAPEVK